MRTMLMRLQLHHTWTCLTRLRRKGQRRLDQGVSLSDPKLQDWSRRITDLGLAHHRLQTQYLQSIDKPDR